MTSYSGSKRISLSSKQIIPLEREKWQDYCLKFHYVANNYYDVTIDRSKDGFHVNFIKKAFDTPFEKAPDDKDKLFQPWWDEVKAWGIIKDGRLIAVVETAVEGWSNRLRVTELWIDDVYRRQGLGTALMDVAVQRARDEKRRAVMLETQSCNERAIAFYLAYGFSLIGFDACAYRNNDIKRKEVRMEMGIFFDTVTNQTLVFL
jgi:ribosomal protein S18 acetylase RimI-like enzyme